MKTLFSKQLSGNERKWYVVDAKGKTLGRLATSIARVISGRDRVDYTQHTDNGAYVVVLNVADIVVSGNKEATKMYRTHSQFLGGLKEANLARVRVKDPAHILRHAVDGMLPKNRLREDMIDRLKLVVGSTHQYEAQKPESLAL
jgi:large subunit ribosomal protein L13